MNAPAQRPLPRRTRLASALLALPLLGALLSDLLRGGDAYGAGDLPLLAALWGLALTGCAGHLLAGRVPFDRGTLLRACAALPRGSLPAAPPPEHVPAGAGELPPAVLPLLSSYFALYAGLGGWTGGLTRGAVLRPAGVPAFR